MRQHIAIFTYLTVILPTLLFGQNTSTQRKQDYSYYHCDSAKTTYEINICSAKNFEIADSLLNVEYKNVINYYEKGIIDDKQKIQESKLSGKKEDIEFWQKDIQYYERMKNAIINSQREWIKLRDANAYVAQIGCEDGSGCNQIVNDSMTSDTYERIEKLKDFK